MHGRAELAADPAVLERLTARGQPALLAIRVHVEQCFFHCAKAFKRAQPLAARHRGRRRCASRSASMLAPKSRRRRGRARAEIDRAIEEDYETNL